VEINSPLLPCKWCDYKDNNDRDHDGRGCEMLNYYLGIGNELFEYGIGTRTWLRID
jgi:hypothetical protein